MKKRILVLMTAFLLMGTQLYAGNGDLIVDGKLGVGTASPSSKLQVDLGKILVRGDYNGGATSWPIIGSSIAEVGYTTFGTSINHVTESSGNNTYGLAFYTQASYLTGQTEKLRITGSGNVGIGTTSPGAKLEVNTSNSAATNLAAKFLNPNTNQAGAQILIGPYSDNYMSSISATGFPYSTLATDLWLRPRKSDATLGMGIYISPSDNVGIGTATPAGKLDVWGQIYQSGSLIHSDIKFKKNLLPITDPVSKILGLSGLSYEWRNEEFRDRGFPEGRHYGVIAQEVEKVLPEVVTERPDGTKTVAYTEIIPVLIEAIKEQQKEIEELKKRLSELR